MVGGRTALFRQLAQTLGEAIESGAVAVGDLLPTEAELCRRYDVSRHTVREALSDLRSRGLIESKQGIGSIVVRQQSRATYTETYSSVEELTRFAQGTPVRVYSLEDVVADADLAGRLRSRPGLAWLRLCGVRHDRQEADVPVGHVEVYVDAAYAGIREQAWTLQTSVMETVEKRYGLTVARIEQEIGVELLDDEQARTLKAEVGSPALVIRRWYIADNGRNFEVAFSRYPMGRFAYRNVLLRNAR
ncbi:MAG: GntR family transcriptional regulator [Rhizobiaceae bacterium]|nr:GntR family transcriptional regulator [Rhizobiaceae bacterium]